MLTPNSLVLKCSTSELTITLGDDCSKNWNKNKKAKNSQITGLEPIIFFIFFIFKFFMVDGFAINGFFG